MSNVEEAGGNVVPALEPAPEPGPGPAPVQAPIGGPEDSESDVLFADIVGQELAKRALQENVIWPALRPQLFTGLLAPIKGLLLYGPPGNGKTMLANALRNECDRMISLSRPVVYYINMSVLTNYGAVGGDGAESAARLQGVFHLARSRPSHPSIVFIDDLDFVLTDRKTGYMDNLKKELLVQLEALQDGSHHRIMVVGATNKLEHLNAGAALRYFPERVQMRMPTYCDRVVLIQRLLHNRSMLSCEEFRDVAHLTNGYSFRLLRALARKAALAPLMDPVGELQLQQVDHQPQRVTFDDILRSHVLLICSEN